MDREDGGAPSAAAVVGPETDNQTDKRQTAPESGGVGLGHEVDAPADQRQRGRDDPDHEPQPAPKAAAGTQLPPADYVQRDVRQDE